MHYNYSYRFKSLKKECIWRTEPIPFHNQGSIPSRFIFLVGVLAVLIILAIHTCSVLRAWKKYTDRCWHLWTSKQTQVEHIIVSIGRHCYTYAYTYVNMHIHCVSWCHCISMYIYVYLCISVFVPVMHINLSIYLYLSLLLYLPKHCIHMILQMANGTPPRVCCQESFCNFSAVCSSAAPHAWSGNSLAKRTWLKKRMPSCQYVSHCTLAKKI